MLINEETMKEILSHYAPIEHSLLEGQIRRLESIIAENKDEYLSDEGFRKALDLILTKIIEGNFL